MQPLAFRSFTIPTVIFIQQNVAWFRAAKLEVPKFFHTGTHDQKYICVRTVRRGRTASC